MTPIALRCTSRLAVIAGALLINTLHATPLPKSTQPNSASSSERAPVNPRPGVIPSLQDWHGSRGHWQLQPDTRIVVSNEQASRLHTLAEQIATDLATMSSVRPHLFIGSHSRPGDIVLTLAGFAPPLDGRLGDEGYTLDVSDAVVLRANSVRGLFYATRSLLQMMLLTDSTHRDAPRGDAIDYPRYSERSLLLDVGRKFADVKFLKQYLRYMGWYKYNTLHLHLNDQVRTEGDSNPRWISRNFRLKSDNPALGDLTPTDGKTYSRTDWAELEKVAAANGIRLLPEIDSPGHAGAFVLAKPQLAYVGDLPQGGTLDPRKPETLAYMKAVFATFLPWFKGDSVNIGGDEVNVNHGDISTADQLNYLNQLGRFVQQRGKKVQVWGSADFAAGLDKSFRIQRWINWGQEAKINWHQKGFAWTESYGDWYVVPFGPSYFNPKGLSASSLYDSWDTRTPADAAGPDAPTGGQISVWNDRGEQNYDYAHTVDGLIHGAIPAAGQLFWRGVEMSGQQVVPWELLQQRVDILRQGPRVDHPVTD